MLAANPWEVRARLDDLQQGLGQAVIFFRGGSEYRACFAGDSWFIIRELKPEETDEDLWPHFCGHIYALTQFVQEMEVTIGSPGLRVVISRGALAQLTTPDNWQEPELADFTRNWFVLTGASEAFIKCQEVERSGSGRGFVGGYFWHESPEKERMYWGTPFFKLPPKWYEGHDYPGVYEYVCRKRAKEVDLSTEDPAS